MKAGTAKPQCTATGMTHAFRDAETPIGAARFRLRVRAAHKPEEAREAARVIDKCIADARAHLTSAFGTGLV
jgi:hypothetical protein